MTVFIVKIYYGQNRATEYTTVAATPRAAGNQIRMYLAKRNKNTKVKILRMTVTEQK